MNLLRALWRYVWQTIDSYSSVPYPPINRTTLEAEMRELWTLQHFAARVRAIWTGEKQ